MSCDDGTGLFRASPGGIESASLSGPPILTAINSTESPLLPPSRLRYEVRTKPALAAAWIDCGEGRFGSYLISKSRRRQQRGFGAIDRCQDRRPRQAGAFNPAWTCPKEPCPIVAGHGGFRLEGA